MATLEHTWLGELELSPHLRLAGVLDWSAVNVAETRTIDGQHVYFTDSKTGGRQLVLDGEGYHFTAAQIRAIQTLQAAAQPVLLRHHQGEFRVLIVSISGINPWIDYVDYADDDFFSATINLIEVPT